MKGCNQVNKKTIVLLFIININNVSLLLVSSWWWSHPLDIQHVTDENTPYILHVTGNIN
jgi:hypothetical protein